MTNYDIEYINRLVDTKNDITDSLLNSQSYIEYQNKINYITNMLLKMKAAGTNVTTYFKQLENIKNQLEKDISLIKKQLEKSNCKNFMISYCEVIYNNAVKNLIEKIEIPIQNYDFCFSLYNYCLTIEPIILKMLNAPKEKIDKDILNKYVSRIKDCLINLFKNKEISFDEKGQVIEKLFSIVYNLIKIEIILNNESTLYSFIKKEKIDSSYIDKLIIEETNNLKADSVEKEEIDKIISKINTKGLKNSYFEINIIKRLLLANGQYNIKEDLKKQYENASSKFEQGKEVMEKAENKIIKIADIKPELQKKLKIVKKNLKRNIIIMSLIGSVSISGILGGIFYVRKNSTRNCLTKTTNITSSETGRNDAYHEDYLSDYKSCPNERYIRVCEPWQNNSEGVTRNVKSYDISYLDLDDNVSVDSIDLNKLELNPKVSKETKLANEITNTDKYSKEIKELVDVNYTYKNEQIDKELVKKYRKNLIVAYAIIYGVYKISLMISIAARKEESAIRIFSLIAPLYRILDLLDSKKDLKNIQEELAKANEELQLNIQTILCHIYSNAALKKKFEECLEENKDLLSDEEALKKEIKEKIADIEATNQHTIKVLKKQKNFKNIKSGLINS